jgi:hypothetical protein
VYRYRIIPGSRPKLKCFVKNIRGPSNLKKLLVGLKPPLLRHPCGPVIFVEVSIRGNQSLPVGRFKILLNSVKECMGQKGRRPRPSTFCNEILNLRSTFFCKSIDIYSSG